MTFWLGSGCGFGPDPDPDADPAIFVSYLQDVNKNVFSKVKSHKEVSKQQESMFFLLLLLDDRKIRIRISD
jgi:hypothetical protein